MTAELLARTWRDVRSGTWLGGVDKLAGGSPGAAVAYENLHEMAARMVAHSDSIIDVTAVRSQILAAYPDGMNPYEENPCVAPPFANAAWGYVINEPGADGTACVLVTQSIDRCDAESAGVVSWDDLHDDFTRQSSYEEGGSLGEGRRLDWDRVRWVQDGLVFVGASSNRRWQVDGPLHMTRWAIYDDGAPAALHWLRLRPDMDPAMFSLMAFTVLRSMDLLNATNIDVEEPARPRPASKRIGRYGVRVDELVLRPPGRRRTSSPPGVPLSEMPLTPVRGHFAHYGPRYGRGLLFGRHEGRFYVPGHVRGSADYGESAREYRVQP